MFPKVEQKMDEVSQAMQTAGQAAAAGSGWSAAKALPVFGKLVAIFGAGAAIATYLVMSNTKQGDDKEFRRALASTFTFAVFGGAGLIRWLNIGHWSNDFFGLVALCGIVILCGVPGWLIVKSYFNFANANQHSQLPELWKKLVEAFKK